MFFLQPFSIGILDFRIRTSDFKFQRSEVPTELLYLYIIDIYLFVKWKHIHMAPSKHIDLTLCWLNVVSLSATLAQH